MIGWWGSLVSPISTEIFLHLELYKCLIGFHVRLAERVQTGGNEQL